MRQGKICIYMMDICCKWHQNPSKCCPHHNISRMRIFLGHSVSSGVINSKYENRCILSDNSNSVTRRRTNSGVSNHRSDKAHKTKAEKYHFLPGLRPAAFTACNNQKITSEQVLHKTLHFTKSKEIERCLGCRLDGPPPATGAINDSESSSPALQCHSQWLRSYFNQINSFFFSWRWEDTKPARCPELLFQDVAAVAAGPSSQVNLRRRETGNVFIQPSKQRLTCVSFTSLVHNSGAIFGVSLLLH